MNKIILWFRKFFAKRTVRKQMRNKAEIISHFERNEEKLFELFKSVLKNHKHIIKFDNDRTVDDENVNFFIRDAVNSEEARITVKIHGGNYLDIYLNNKKASIFKEEFDKYARRNSIKQEILKTKEIEHFLDNLLEKEKETNNEN